MLVRVGQGQEVVPIFLVESGEGGEDEDLFIVLQRVGSAGEIIELVMYNRRRPTNATVGSGGIGLLAESRGGR